MNHKKHISVSFLGLLFFFLINLDNTSGIPIISSQAETDSNAIFQFVHKSISTTAPDSELFYFEKAIQIVSQKVPDEKKTDFLLAIAEQYENHDKYRDALEVYRKVLSIYKERNNKEGIASVTGAIGNIYYFRSIFDKALQYYQEALKLNEEIANKKKVAANLGNIGNIFFLQGEPQQALDFYKKALYIQNQIDDSIGIAKSYINIANVFSDKEEFLDQALAYYNKAY
jgi:tetratricopeptide (TPR) repeat protein